MSERLQPAVPQRDGVWDAESADWLACLAPDAPGRAAALARLHGLLLAATRAELGRRRARVRITGPDWEDLAHQAADDAFMAVTTKLDTFAGRSKFTTWAYKFAILEVSSKLGRHFWRQPGAIPLETAQWERLPDRFGFTPEEAAQSADLLRAIRESVERDLTEHQRAMFVAVVLAGVPLDALVAKLDTNRNAVYKAVFDARRKIRQSLVADGYLLEEAKRA